MTDAEQIEAWRKEFESNLRSKWQYQKKIVNGKYSSQTLENMWQGFLMAKRSQPVIELPRPRDLYSQDYVYEGQYNFDHEIHEAIAKAGYKYEVKV